LLDLPDEARQRALQPLAPIARHRARFNGFAKCVLRSRRAAEDERARVRLSLIFQQWNEPRRFTDGYGQHAGRLRIEGTEMTHCHRAASRVRSVDPSQTSDGLRRGGTGGFKDVDET